jgi:hypothetical protein
VNDTETIYDPAEDVIRLAWRMIRSLSRNLIDLSYMLRKVGVRTQDLAHLRRLALEAENIGFQLHDLADQIDEKRGR